MAFENSHGFWGWKELHRVSKFKPRRTEGTVNESCCNPPAWVCSLLLVVQTVLLGCLILINVIIRCQTADAMTMEIVSLKAVIDSFPVFLLQRQRLPQSAAVQTESSGFLAAAELLYCCWAECYTWGEGERGWDISDISLPLQPRMNTPAAFLWQKCLGLLWAPLNTAEPQDKLIPNCL